MKKYRKIISILSILIITILIVGCSNNKAELKGSYIEEIYDLPEEIEYVYDMQLLADKSIGLISLNKDEKLVYYFSKNNGKIFEKRYQIENSNIESVLIKNNGDIITIRNSNSQYEMYVYKSAEDYKVININNEYFEDYTYLKISLDGNLVINTNSKIYRISTKNGKLLNTIKTNEITKEVAIIDDNIIYTTSNNIYICEINGDNKKEISELKDYNKSIYLINNSGIEENMNFISDGYFFRYNINGDINKLFECGNDVRNIVEINEKEVVTLVEEYGDFKICNYTYTEEVNNKENQIIVYSLYRDDSINQVIKQYMNRNKDIDIKYDYSISNNNKIDINEAIKILNTELLSGKGPDILILDGLPVDTYIKKGILEDISEPVNEHKDVLLENVYNAYNNEDNEIYTFPINIKLPYIIGESKDISNINNLESLTKTIEEEGSKGTRNILNAFKPKQLINQLYYSCKDSWINEDNTLNDKNFEEFLISIKKIYDNSNASLTEDVNKKNQEDFNYAVEADKEEDWYDCYLSQDRYIINVLRDNIKYDLGYMFLSSDFSSIEAINNADKNNDFDFDFWEGQIGKFFIPEYSIAVNKNSKHKDISKEFVSFILDSKNQNKDGLGYISTNKSVINKEILQNVAINESGAIGNIAVYDGDKKILDIPMKYLNELEMEKYISKIEELEKYVSTDVTILNMISRDVESYMLNEKTLEETKKTVKSKLEIYLAE